MHRLKDVNTHCLEQFRAHWNCLEHNNQQLWHCRRFETPLNKCVFDNLVGSTSRIVRGGMDADVVGLRLLEAGEGHSGHTGERDASASTEEADLLAEPLKRGCG